MDEVENIDQLQEEDYHNHNNSNINLSNDNQNYSMIIPSIDPIVWREELERVNTLLTKPSNTSTNPLHMIDSWRNHITTIQKFAIQLNITTNNDKTISNTINKDNELIIDLNILSKDINNSLNSILRNENMINFNEKFQLLITNYTFSCKVNILSIHFIDFYLFLNEFYCYLIGKRRIINKN